MKRILNIIPILFAFTSCLGLHQKTLETPCNVFIHTGPGTKLSGSFADNKVRDIQALVFRADGTLDAYATDALSNDGIAVSTTTGQKSIYVFINTPDLSDVATLTQLNAKTSNLLSDNPVREDGLYPIMSGQKDAILTRDCEITIPVSRYVARVRVEKISNNLTNEALTGSPLTLERMYLTNAVADVSLKDAARTSDLWYNKMGKTGDSPLLCEEFSSSIAISVGESFSGDNTLYLYPNVQEDDSFSSDWCARHSRFVFDAQVAGSLYYYPVTLPVIKRNHSFELKNIVVARVGSLSPEEPLSYAALVLDASQIGQYTNEGKDLEYTNAGEQVLVFCPDGVDPFDYLSEYLDMDNSGQKLLILNDGTVSPFDIAYSYKDLASATFLVYFKNGTVMPYDTLPEDLDVDAVEKIIILNPDNINDFDGTIDQLKDIIAVSVIVYFSNGSIGVYAEVPKDLDMDSVMKIVIIDETLIDNFDLLSLINSMESCTVLVYFKDGTVQAFDTIPEDLDMDTVTQVLLLNNITIGDFSDATEGMDISAIVAIVYFKDGDVQVYTELPQDLDMSAVDRFIVLNPGDVSGFADSLAGLDMRTTTVLLYMSDGTVEIYNNNSESLALSCTSQVVIVSTPMVNPFSEDFQDKVIISSGKTIVLVVGDNTPFASTIEQLSIGNKGDRVIIFSANSLDDFSENGFAFDLTYNPS